MQAFAQAVKDHIILCGTLDTDLSNVNNPNKSDRDVYIKQAIDEVIDLSSGSWYVMTCSKLKKAALANLKEKGVTKTLKLEIKDATDPTIVYMPSTEILIWKPSA